MPNVSNAQLEDGTYSLPYQVNKPGSIDASIANDYFAKPAKLIVTNGAMKVQVTIKQSAWVTVFNATTGGNRVVSTNADANTRVVEFNVPSISSQTVVAMKIDINDIDYHHEYSTDFVWNAAGVQLIEAAKKPEPAKPAQPVEQKPVQQQPVQQQPAQAEKPAQQQAQQPVQQQAQAPAQQAEAPKQEQSTEVPKEEAKAEEKADEEVKDEQTTENKEEAAEEQREEQETEEKSANEDEQALKDAISTEEPKEEKSKAPLFTIIAVLVVAAAASVVAMKKRRA